MVKIRIVYQWLIHKQLWPMCMEIINKRNLLLIILCGVLTVSLLRKMVTQKRMDQTVYTKINNMSSIKLVSTYSITLGVATILVFSLMDKLVPENLILWLAMVKTRELFQWQLKKSLKEFLQMMIKIKNSK